MFKMGLEVLLDDEKLLGELNSKKVALVAHPASVTKDLIHSQDILTAKGVRLNCCFGPQHGMRGEKQDNMIESDDYLDPILKVPVFSLYGEHRRPTSEMMSHFDVMLYDLQDVGCRIYTFLTTLFYVMEACAQEQKSLWVLDRPNPAGRPIEGFNLDMKFESFVGGAPTSMRHSLTLGEAALWYKDHKNLDIDLKVVPCEGYKPEIEPWPSSFPWVNPSPNLPRLTGVFSYGGTVLGEGTWLSEGRGTTTPLEVMGAPGIDGVKLVDKMNAVKADWLEGALLRPCFFEPTFQKHAQKLCSGFQIHVDHPGYNHGRFKPYRLTCLLFKTLRELYPDFDLWRQPPYEYEKIKLPIDILAGTDQLRLWVDDPQTEPEDLEKELQAHEAQWSEEIIKYKLY